MSVTATAWPDLVRLGLTPAREASFAPFVADGLVPGRVVRGAGRVVAATPDGEVEVIAQRRFSREAGSALGMPTIGDWLALDPTSGPSGSAAVRAVLPRAGSIVRTRPSDGTSQILAANVDVAFLVSGLDHDLDPARIERYLVIAREGGVEPVVVLNKSDVSAEPEAARDTVRARVGDATILTLSAATGEGLEAIRDRIGAGRTAVLLGSSGVGKSTITNALLGEARQAVKAVRSDDSRGRHTTVHRELFVLDSGGLVIDTPGLRTVGVTAGAEGIDASFDDIAAFAEACRFRDCGHESEPGCAVREAIEAGDLSEARLVNHRKLEAERRAAEERADVRARRANERRVTRTYRDASRDAARFKRS